MSTTAPTSNESSGLIPILNWFDTPAKQSINAVFAGLNRGVEALDLFNRFRSAQFQIVKSQVSAVKILGMSAPIPLASIYSPAYFSTTISNRLFREEWLKANNIEELQRRRTEEREKSLILGDEVVEKYQYVVVLGGPGSGKTTFIRHIALAYADSKVFNNTKLKASLLPIFVALPSFAKSTASLFDYFSKPLVERTKPFARAYLERALDKGLVVVLLDSLDEVAVPERKRVLEAIQTLRQRFSKAKIILTCRTADYEGGLEQFHECEIARLSPSAVNKIIRAWFRDAQEKGNQLIRLLRGDRGVNSLTETPLLLSLLCIQFKHDLILPKRKTELYRRCVDTLLREWDTSRQFRRDSIYSELTDERKERIFEHVAGAFFEDRVKLVFPERELVQKLGKYIPRYNLNSSHARGILGEIEKHHGILEKVAVDMYAFCHTSFQEYFVARDLLARRVELERIKASFEDDNWSSVIEFISAMHEDPEPMLNFLIEHSEMNKLKNYPAMARRTKVLWLIYRCMSAGASVTPKFAKKLYEHLFRSQVEMGRIYRGGGVFPIAVLERDGVRHSFFYFNRRPTLSAALQPYRMLSNEMILAPLEGYAETVLENIGTLDLLLSKEADTFARKALKLCLLIPIVPVRQKEVKGALEQIMDPPKKSEQSGLNRFIQESLEMIEERARSNKSATLLSRAISSSTGA